MLDLFKKEYTINVIDKRRKITYIKRSFGFEFYLKYLINKKWVRAERFKCSENNLKEVEEMTNLLLSIRENYKLYKKRNNGIKYEKR